jgi:hypothetical protein
MFAQAKGVTIVKPGNPQNNKWVLIARTETKLNLDQDVVVINGKNVFRAIKFRVTHSPIEIFDLDVVFENGEHQDLAVKNIFQPNTESRVLDLPGNKRKIRSIVIKYRSRGNLFNQRAYVQFWGLR